MVKERQPKLVTVSRISMKDKGQTHVLSVGFGHLQPGSDWMRTRKCLDSMDRIHLNSSHSTHFPLAHWPLKSDKGVHGVRTCGEIKHMHHMQIDT